MNTRRLVGLALVLGIVAMLAPADVRAACTVGGSFAQNRLSQYACGGYYCYIKSAGDNTLASVQGQFWSLTTGDPAPGAGDDNGGFPSTDWLSRYSPAYPIYIAASGWDADNRIDGCIQNKIPAGKAEEVMVAAFTDTNSATDSTLFGVAAVRRVLVNSPEFDFSFGNTGGVFQDIVLVDLPAPSIVSSTSVGANQVDVTVACPDLSPGFYTDGSALVGEVILGCQIHQQQLAHNAVAPTGRDRTGWSDTGVLIASGSQAVVSITCAADSSNWLSAGLAMDSGFQGAHVSANSSRIDCGPNIADPKPKFKLIDRQKPNTIRPRR